MTAAISRTHPLDSTVLRKGIAAEITPESVREQILRLIEFHCPWAHPTLADNVSPDGDKELSIFCLSTESGEYALEISFISTAHNLVRDGLQPIGGRYLWVTTRFGRVYGKAREDSRKRMDRLSEAREASLAKAKSKNDALDLIDAIRDFSEEAHWSAWHPGVEFEAWQLALESNVDCAFMLDLSEECGGWWYWSEEYCGELFVTTEEWEKMVAEREKK